MKKGYYGIAIYQPKTMANLGMILRSAHNFKADFIAVIGSRYYKTGSDTTDATKHVPTFYYDTLEQFIKSLDKKIQIVRVEVDGNHQLESYVHPKQAVYILGGEDRSVPKIEGSTSIKIDTQFCLNLAVSASIMMYDRNAKK